jgi:ERCC4-type nuclease
MSVLIDDRENPSLLAQLDKFGVPYSVARLDFGDIAIRAANGWLVGYERKRVPDLVNSMQDRRLAGHQLKGMRKLYDRCELIVEGLWRAGEDGDIEVVSGGRWVTLFAHGAGVNFRQLDSYLYSQYEKGGVPCWRSNSTFETASILHSRWHWWQKEYDAHKSFDVIFSRDPRQQSHGSVELFHGDPSPTTILAAQIPGIDTKAWDVGKWFDSPYAMVSANPRDWMEVEWTDRSGKVKHFGKDTAMKIVSWLRGNQ